MADIRHGACQCTWLLIVVFVNVISAANIDETKESAKTSFISLLKNIVNINEKRIDAVKHIDEEKDFRLGSYLSKIHKLNYDSEEYETNQKAYLRIIDLRDSSEKMNNKIFRMDKDIIELPKKRLGRSSKDNIVAILILSDQNSEKEKNKIFQQVIPIKQEEDDDASKKKTDNVVFVFTFDYGKGKESQCTDMSYEAAEREASSWESKGDRQNTRKSREICSTRAAAKSCRSACSLVHEQICTRYKCIRRARQAFRKECKRTCTAAFVGSKNSEEL